ncbi:MAG: helix-turn-helix domain-containing protein [Myxococcota bacterium]|jgi:DNA-binding HxlR family transcriptional regulator|nr:helix-turn-helix domain-containing protein [Myxococcota bacterium]
MPGSTSVLKAVKGRKRRASVPRPGHIFDPVARALEVIGDRWTLVLVRQLLGGNKGFQELRMRTGITPRVLSSRLQKLTKDGFIYKDGDDARSLYALTDRGRSLEPIIASIALWWTRQPIEAHAIEPDRFTETSPQSILESLPFLLRDEAAREGDVTFEIRLTGEGGGVWAVEIVDGHCTVTPGFAEGADVRYTADARLWCGVALGLVEARELVRRGDMVKEGGPQAMNHYFHQIYRPEDRTSD